MKSSARWLAFMAFMAGTNCSNGIDAFTAGKDLWATIYAASVGICLAIATVEYRRVARTK